MAETTNAQKLDILAQEHGKVLNETAGWMERALNAERKLQNMAPPERTTAGGQPMSQYWREAWRQACERERKTTPKHEAMKEEMNRWKQEALKLRKILVAKEAMER